MKCLNSPAIFLVLFMLVIAAKAQTTSGNLDFASQPTFNYQTVAPRQPKQNQDYSSRYYESSSTLAPQYVIVDNRTKPTNQPNSHIIVVDDRRNQPKDTITLTMNREEYEKYLEYKYSGSMPTSTPASDRSSETSGYNNNNLGNRGRRNHRWNRGYGGWRNHY